MTPEHKTCYAPGHVEAILAARADDLAQLTAAVAALTETVRLQGERIDRIEAHRTTIIGEVNRRLEEIERVIGNEVALSIFHTQRLDSIAGRVARLNATVRRQTGGQ